MCRGTAVFSLRRSAVFCLRRSRYTLCTLVSRHCSILSGKQIWVILAALPTSKKGTWKLYFYLHKWSLQSARKLEAHTSLMFCPMNIRSVDMERVNAVSSGIDSGAVPEPTVVLPPASRGTASSRRVTESKARRGFLTGWKIPKAEVISICQYLFNRLKKKKKQQLQLEFIIWNRTKPRAPVQNQHKGI